MTAKASTKKQQPSAADIMNEAAQAQEGLDYWPEGASDGDAVPGNDGDLYFTPEAGRTINGELIGCEVIKMPSLKDPLKKEPRVFLSLLLTHPTMAAAARTAPQVVQPGTIVRVGMRHKLRPLLRLLMFRQVTFQVGIRCAGKTSLTQGRTMWNFQFHMEPLDKPVPAKDALLGDNVSDPVSAMETVGLDFPADALPHAAAMSYEHFMAWRQGQLQLPAPGAPLPALTAGR